MIPHGLVPMEVGAMKSADRKGDKGKKGFGNGNMATGKSFGGNRQEHEYGKGFEKGKDKGEQWQRQGTRKRWKISTQLELRRPLQVMWQVGP